MNARDAIAAREARMRERQRPAPTRDELTAMRKPELLVLAEIRGVSTAGTKADLVERLS